MKTSAFVQAVPEKSPLLVPVLTDAAKGSTIADEGSTDMAGRGMGHDFGMINVHNPERAPVNLPLKRLQTQKAGPTNAIQNTVPAIIPDVLQASGKPLDQATRSFMEPRFGYDFHPVRVHDDAKATESARSIHAAAYTLGSDIVVDAAQYRPGSAKGKEILAHELTHVVQASPLSKAGASSSPVHVLESEARQVAKAVRHDAPMPPISGSAGNFTAPLRIPATENDAPTFGNLYGDKPFQDSPYDKEDLGWKGPLQLVKDENERWHTIGPTGRTRFRARGEYAFVIRQGRIFVVKPAGAMGFNVGHTEAAGGGRVEYAGMATFTNSGQLVSWTNGSGHYKPVAAFNKVAIDAGFPAGKFIRNTGNRAPGGPQAQLPVFQPKAMPPADAINSPPPLTTTPNLDEEPASVPVPKRVPPNSSPKNVPHTDLEEGVPAPRGGLFKGMAIQYGMAAASVLLDLLRAYIIAKIDEEEINKGITEKWPAVQKQIAAFSAEIEKLHAQPATEKIYAVVDVTVVRGRTFTFEGTSESAAQVDTIAASGVSATEKTVEPHDVMYDDVLLGTFNRKTIFTFSVPLWSRAQEQAEARFREQADIAERLRKLQAQPKTPPPTTLSNTPSPPPQSTGPTLLPPTAQAAPSFLPGAPGEGPIEQAARTVDAFKQVANRLETQGNALLNRLTSASAPTMEERQSFLRSEAEWRLSVKYMINWFTDRSRTEAVQALRQLLEDTAMAGPKLAQMRIQLGG